MRFLLIATAVLLCAGSCTDPSKSSPQSQPTEMKTINYRGGLVRFRIPAQWIEEYEDDGGGTFYEDDPDSPTLRLNILTMESPRPIDTSEMLSSRAEKAGQEIMHLKNGNSVIAYNQPAEEDGLPLVIYYWELANAVPPKHGRIAIFSLTILKSQQTDPEITKTIELIGREVGLCEFSHELGI